MKWRNSERAQRCLVRTLPSGPGKHIPSLRQEAALLKAEGTGTLSPYFQPGIPAGVRKPLANVTCFQENSVLSNCQGPTVSMFL